MRALDADFNAWRHAHPTTSTSSVILSANSMHRGAFLYERLDFVNHCQERSRADADQRRRDEGRRAYEPSLGDSHWVPHALRDLPWFPDGPQMLALFAAAVDRSINPPCRRHTRRVTLRALQCRTIC
jgi:hypothetical protein